MDFQSEKSFGKLRLWAFQPYHQILCILKHVEDVKDNLQHLQHALTYIGMDGMVGKLSVSAFQNFFRIENPLSIREVMSQNVCVCSFPIFDIFDIHSITALRCIWCIFDIFDIHSITALRCIWSIFDIFDIHRIIFKWYHIKKGMIKVCLYVLFPSSTYIALQPLGVFDLSSTSSTSSTYIALHPLGVFDLSLTLWTLLWSLVFIYLNTFNIKQYVLTRAL